MLSLSAEVCAEPPRTSTEFVKLTASDGIYGDGFGFSLAVSGDDLVVGAPGYIIATGEVVGAAYVFRRSGPRWIQTAQLFVDFGVPPMDYEAFGWSVAIAGDLIVVGAPQIFPAVIGGGYGTAYVFRRYDPGTPEDALDDQWNGEAKLTSPDEIRYGDMFGYSVAVSGGTILVGRPGWDFSSGSAYSYRRVNGAWRHIASLNPSDSVLDDAFGHAVSLSGTVALVGAHRRSDDGTHSGAGYVFRETGGVWVEECKLTASDGAAGDFFGYSVSLLGERAVAGAYADDDAGPTSGSAYVFTHKDTPWSNETKLLCSDASDLDSFGQSVATDGNTIIVGAPGKGSVPNSVDHIGAAYLFHPDADQWVEERKLVASDPAQNAVLGASVAVGGNYAYVGAQEAVYVYVVPSAAHSLRDFAAFQTCFHGDQPSSPSECARFDLVPDGRIDLRDYNEFLALLAGP